LTEDVAGVLVSLGQRLANIEQALAELRHLLRHQDVVKEYYSTGEVAEAMGVSVYTVAARWCAEGRIECEKDPNTGKWRVPGREFERLVKGGGWRPGWGSVPPG
jgi:hypothetical protein